MVFCINTVTTKSPTMSSPPLTFFATISAAIFLLMMFLVGRHITLSTRNVTLSGIDLSFVNAAGLSVSGNLNVWVANCCFARHRPCSIIVWVPQVQLGRWARRSFGLGTVLFLNITDFKEIHTGLHTSCHLRLAFMRLRSACCSFLHRHAHFVSRAIIV
jgi:hypothetical protein